MLYNPSMPIPVLTTKLYIPPPPPRVVARPRLVERMNQGLLEGRKLTLISAPAGFGKTTLITEWVAELTPTPSATSPIGRLRSAPGGGEAVRVAWLSLDEEDSDPRRFLIYVVAALQTFAPQIGADLLKTFQTSRSLPDEPLLAALLNEIAASPGKFIFVLDDYHLVDARPVDQILAFLVKHLPPRMHLVMTTREDPQLPLARLRARDQLTELRTADLRFTPAEAADFLNQAMGLDLSAEDIAALESRTEGWIAGLQLAAISMQGHRNAASFIHTFSGSHHFVLDYLLEEVLLRQSEEIQSFLLRTSILSRLCGPLCDAFLQSADGSSQETLEYLERANLFVMPLDDERRWYRYHHLFGDLLRQRLSQNLAPEEIAGYHIRASDWYEKNGDEAEAFHHAIAARDLDRAARLVETTWQGMDATFQTATWLGWVKQLPENVILARPVLCTQIGWAFMDASEVEASEARLRDAERRLEGPAEGMVIVEEEQYRTLPARIAIARSYNAQVQGNPSAAAAFAEQALRLIPDQDEFLRAQARAMLMGVHWSNGELEAAYNDMSAWAESATKAGNFIFAIATAFARADILIALGRLREAERIYHKALQFAALHGMEAQGLLAHHHLGLAMLYHEMRKDEAAAQYFQKSMELGQQSPQVDWPYRKCLAQARWKESDGELEAALERLDEAQRVYVQTPIPDMRPIEAVKARVYLRQGQLPKVRDWMRRQGLSVDDRLSYLREFEHVTLARALIAAYQGSRAERSIRDALGLLERLLSAAQAGNRGGSLLEILIVTALAHRTRGDSPPAFALLERALALAEPEGYVRIFADEGEPMRSLLLDFRSWLEQGARGQDRERPGYVSKLLSAFGEPEHTDTSNASPVEPLSPRELEVLRLIAQGLSNGEISQRLFLAMSTVKGHNLRIFGKLQAKSRTEAVARARELGLL